MNGPTSRDEIDDAYNKVFEAGGDFYDFVDQMDIPDSHKQKYIVNYENAWIELHYIDIGEFPGEGTHEEKMEYVQKKLDAINQYKIDHPKYADEIRKACKEETQQRYEE